MEKCRRPIHDKYVIKSERFTRPCRPVGSGHSPVLRSIPPFFCLRGSPGSIRGCMACCTACWERYYSAPFRAGGCVARAGLAGRCRRDRLAGRYALGVAAAAMDGGPAGSADRRGCDATDTDDTDPSLARHRSPGTRPGCLTGTIFGYCLRPPPVPRVDQTPRPSSAPARQRCRAPVFRFSPIPWPPRRQRHNRSRY
jgi:hypothetical protein